MTINNSLKFIKDLVLSLNIKSLNRRNNKISYSLVINYSFSPKVKTIYPLYSLYGWKKSKQIIPGSNSNKKKVVSDRIVFFESINQIECLKRLSNMVEELENGK